MDGCVRTPRAAPPGSRRRPPGCRCGVDRASRSPPAQEPEVNRGIRRLVLAYSARSRRRKADRIVELMHRIGARRILLVGGMASGTEPNEGIVERIVGAHAVEVVSINLYDPGPQPWPYVVADGCLMPFQDRSFDLVVSNAVIEHVGEGAGQGGFVREHLGVCHAWGMAPPNRWFPVESHPSMLFRHWSPS